MFDLLPTSAIRRANTTRTEERTALSLARVRVRDYDVTGRKRDARASVYATHETFTKIDSVVPHLHANPPAVT